MLKLSLLSLRKLALRQNLNNLPYDMKSGLSKRTGRFFVCFDSRRISSLRLRAPWLHTKVCARRRTQRALTCSALKANGME
jgi:hypothetical protein